MIKIKPDSIEDAEGRSLVVLTQKEFDEVLEELEELEDIRLYDEAKKNDNGERILIEEAFKIIEDKRKNRKMLAGRIAYEAELVKNESLHVIRNFDPFE